MSDSQATRPPVDEQPNPIPPLEYRNAPTNQSDSTPSGSKTTAMRILCNIVGCPVKCPVCVCDFFGHTSLACAHFPHIEEDLRRQQERAGCCTACAAYCFPAACINPQRTEEDRQGPRRALQVTEWWFAAASENACVGWVTILLCAPLIPCCCCAAMHQTAVGYH